MEFKLVEDDVAKVEIEEEESSIGSSEFFRSEEEVEFSTSEEDEKWEDSEEEEVKVDWTVPKRETVRQVKKTHYISGGALKYELKTNIFTTEARICKLARENNALIILDRTGSLYIIEDGRTHRIEVGIERNLQFTFEDFAVQGNLAVCVGRNRKSVIAVNIEEKTIREIRNHNQRNIQSFRKARFLSKDTYAVAGDAFVLIYSAKSHLLLSTIETAEQVLDIHPDQDNSDILYILTCDRLITYSKTLQAQTSHTEAIVLPECISVAGDKILVGSSGSLSIRNKYTLGLEKEYSNLEKVTDISHSPEFSISIFSNSEQENGVRIIDMQTQKIVKNFPNKKIFTKVTSTCPSKEGFYIAAGRQVHHLEIKK